MSLAKIGILVLLAAMVACAQILFKIAAVSIKEPVGLNLHSIVWVVLNPYFISSLAIYGSTTIVWVLLLRDVDLSKAYLIAALSIVLVAIASTFVLGEALAPRLLIGMAIILVGLGVALG